MSRTSSRAVGDDNKPDFTGKRVVVVGGGNVAIDGVRSSIRFGAAKVFAFIDAVKI